MLKKTVFVKGINNLSDARYCAGMGVEYLCFEIDPQNENFLSTEKIVEIKNWLVGVSFGIRITQNTNVSDEILETISPDFILTDTKTAEDLEIPIPIFVEDSKLSFDSEGVIFTNVEVENFKNISSSSFVENNWTIDKINELLDSDYDFGIVLQGGKESRPGFSDYGDLMDILELLDE